MALSDAAAESVFVCVSVCYVVCGRRGDFMWVGGESVCRVGWEVKYYL